MSTTRRLSAIMFTDLVGFTASAQADEESALRRLKELESLVRPLIPPNGGREVKSTGDGMLVEFDSALRAVDCAIHIQEAVEEHNRAQTSPPIQLRIGIHVGDVEERDRDVFGDAVNVAARVVTVAEPGGVCLSQQAYDQVRNRGSRKFERLPAQSLKGLRGPVDLYRVELRAPAHSPTRPQLHGIDGAPRLAVLPLTNISPDPSDEYFADGLTEELIAALSQLRSIRVIARTSVSQYKGTSKTISQIGSELDVTHVVEGSVRKAGNRIRITLQLIEAANQEHVWANSYNRELNDVFQVQAEIAEETAKALKVQVLGSRPVSSGARRTISPEAYEACLRGVVALHQDPRTNIHDAMRWFERATQLEPTFAEAYSRWAHAHTLALGETLPFREAYPAAKRLVEKALELDPDSSEAHMAAGSLAMQGDHDWEKAEVEYRRATQINPSNSEAYEWLGVLLFVLQRYDEANEAFRTAERLNPGELSPRAWQVTALMTAGKVQEAIAMGEELVKKRDVTGDTVRLAAAYYVAGRADDARRIMATGGSPKNSQHAYYLAVYQARSGDPTFARELLENPTKFAKDDYLSSTRMAGLRAVLGQKDLALELLEKDLKEGDRTLWWDYQFAALDDLREDPRFKDLLRRYRLPPEPPPFYRALSRAS